MQVPDTIEIRRLAVTSWIGVPSDERSAPQTLFVTLRLRPSQGFAGLADQITNTVDYHAVALEIESLAAAKPRHLIETLAVEIADHLLKNHPLSHLAVSIEKHILPNTECVAVHLDRGR